MEKYVCIHGHFYQPPRENPWLDEIEPQDGAMPYHDWNARIAAECYERNVASRILDLDKNIVKIVNNYSKVSFNFGPTLLSWLEKKQPETYQAVLQADKVSQGHFSGHGSALAQVYNHLIMPLANSRDKRTQVIWGIKDFEYRFKRKPEGMWLAETAVDLESLDIMAEEGIKFTILAPRQAKRVRKLDDGDKWKEVSPQKIDPKIPYVCKLPSGRTIVIFFYDGPISQAIAFEGLLNSGETFASRLTGAFSLHPNHAEMVNIATDGESYGHHHRFGDMALAYCIHHLELNKSVRISIYGEFLEKFPSLYEVEIFENSSWSCIHGLERWRADCGCHSGKHSGWNQKWRVSLREGLDWLRDQLATTFEKEEGFLGRNVWELRNFYIDVILNRSSENINKFLREHIHRELSEDEKVRVLKMFEMQYNTLLMYTSCGWFFDEISGIETTQIIKYAARAIQLAKEISGEDFEGHFVEILKNAKSNLTEYQDGAWIYNTLIKPSIVDLLRVGAHYAMTSLYEQYPKETKLYCYDVKSDSYERKETGRLNLAIGHARVKSNLTWERNHIYFVVLHLGDHNFIGAADYFKTDEEFSLMQKQIISAFLEGRIPAVINLINKYFGLNNYSLWHLFKQEQQKILNKVLESVTGEIEASFRNIFEHHYPLMQLRDQIQIPLPKALATIVEFVLHHDLCQELESEEINIEKLQLLVGEMKRWKFERNKANISYVASCCINQLMFRFSQNPDDIKLMETITAVLENISQLALDLDLWKAQNICFSTGKAFFIIKQKQASDDEANKKWLSVFENLANLLQVKVS